MNKEYALARTDEEIADCTARAIESKDEHGTRWPGMSFEEGVIAALDWLTGESDDHPMESEQA